MIQMYFAYQQGQIPSISPRVLNDYFIFLFYQIPQADLQSLEEVYNKKGANRGESSSVRGQEVKGITKKLADDAIYNK